MTRGGRWRAVALGLAVLMVQGCTTVSYEGGHTLSLPGRMSSPGEVILVSTHQHTSPSEDEWRQEAGARRAEVEWALAQMGALASGEEQVGTVLRFTFWVERGALTLLSHRRGVAEAERGQSAKAEAFTEELRGLFTLLAERRTGALTFTLHRGAEPLAGGL